MESECMVLPYNPKQRGELRKIFNNIYVKNIPTSWDEAKLTSVFSIHGNITSAILRSQMRGEEESKYAFVCYGAPKGQENDRDYGANAANEAVTSLDGQTFDGQILYVKPALKKDEREKEKKKEVLRYKNSKKRCNLHVKNFPPTTTKEEL
jgi:RNA recognition motif-containing protein